MAVVVVAVVAFVFVLAGVARAEDCQPGSDGSPGDYGYNASCGPEYESPSWGNAGGWTEPSQYSTIKLADITGNGQDELIARNSDGLEIWRFDTTLGQWRPAIGADGLPEVLNEFRSPMPNEPTDSHGANPMIYSTIQAAQVLGNGTESIVAQFPDGTHTYDYVPPPGTRSIDGGKWLQEPVSGPSGDLPPYDYLNMRVIPVIGGVTPATLVFQDAYWVHTGPGTPGGGSWAGTGLTTLSPETTDPRYYLDNRAALWPVQSLDFGGTQLRPVDIYRTADGIGWQIYDPSRGVCGLQGECTNAEFDLWDGVPTAFAHGYGHPGPPVTPFSDVDSAEFGCASENFNCFGTGPDFYETLQVANNLRGPGDQDGYVLGRMSGGLHVFASSGGSDWDTSIPVLTALKDRDTAPYTPPPGTWSSIRTGDVTGDGRTDVLAVVDGQLKAWELEPNGSGGWSWSELPADVPLDLGQSYEDNASYYSTIQVGPVAGAGYPDGVIARGPFGIRTWFYCTGSDSSPVPACLSAGMLGKSGWTSWLPQGSGSYPPFTGGQANAWTALNALAKSKGLIDTDESSVRDVWTASNPPSTDQLDTLSDGLALAAGCSQESSVNPPTYGACTPPPGSSGFSGSDWTTVVNETLADIYAAKQVLTYYSNLGNLRRDSFLAEGATLPSIANSVSALNGEAGNTTDVSAQGVISAGIGIVGAVAGILQPELAAALSVASYVVSAIPSASPSLTAAPFDGTMTDLQNKFAVAVGEEDAAQEQESYEVRQNWGLLRLVGELTAPSGAWHTIDYIGLKSAMEEGYVLYAYRKLLPTVYDRYVIDSCQGEPEHIGDTDCFWAGFAGSVGTPPNFTTLMPPPLFDYGSRNERPCFSDPFLGTICYYNNHPPDNPPDDISTQVWGKVSNSCSYTGQADTQWKFGCNLGVDPNLSTAIAGDANGWTFTMCHGSPDIIGYAFHDNPRKYCNPPGVASTGPDGSVTLTVSTNLPPSFQVQSAALPANRALYEPGFGDLLSRSDRTKTTAGLTSGGPGHLGAIDLTVDNSGQTSGSSETLLDSSPGEPTASLKLTSNPTASGAPPATTMRLQLRGLQVAIPAACQQLPASVSMTSPPFTLDTSLEFTDGQSTRTVSIPSEWECVHNPAGEITGLRTINPQAPAERPGLAVSIKAPRHVTPGSIATYTVRVRNTRSGASTPEISSLWNVQTRLVLNSVAEASPNTPAQSRPRERLRQGKSETLRMQIHIPADAAASARVCVTALATADSARPATAQTCTATPAE